MSLFKNHYYHRTTRTYAAVLFSIFSELKIKTENKVVEIPLTPLSGNRGKPEGQSPTNGVYPRGTIGFIGYVPDDSRQLNNNGGMVRSKDHKNSQVMRMPMGYQFKLSYRFKKSDDAYQVVEQVVPAFTPSLDFKWVDNKDLDNEQNVKVKLDSFDIDDNWEGAGEEPDYYDVTFTLTLNGHMYRHTRSGDSEIKTVVIDLAVHPEKFEELPTDLSDTTKQWIKVPEAT
ncbi:tail sheath stabilizer [Vibrio phage D528]|nr:hypothetical protein MYOV002v2_p0210 [Vibrio phage 144E46.1]